MNNEFTGRWTLSKPIQVFVPPISTLTVSNQEVKITAAPSPSHTLSAEITQTTRAQYSCGCGLSGTSTLSLPLTELRENLYYSEQIQWRKTKQGETTKIRYEFLLENGQIHLCSFGKIEEKRSDMVAPELKTILNRVDGPSPHPGGSAGAPAQDRM